MTSELRAALDNAYIVFGPYKDEGNLARKSGINRSLRELTHDDWDKMDSDHDLIVVVYDSVQLRHFLPRWLEFLCERAYEPYDPYWGFSDLARKLNDAGWLRWPAAEVAALRAVFMGWASKEFAAREGRFPLQFLLEIKEELPPYLDLWLDARPFELAQWLQTVDWQKRPDVLQWVTLPRVEAQLEEAFFASPDGEPGRVLSYVVQLVRALQTPEGAA